MESHAATIDVRLVSDLQEVRTFTGGTMPVDWPQQSMSFIPSDGSVSGYFLRCEWHRKQFLDFLKENRHPDGIRGIVAWLFRSAGSVGIRDEHLHQIVVEVDAARPELGLLQIAGLLTAEEISLAAHPPEFELGQRVSVTLNVRNLTPHTGEICDRVWHHKEGKWKYFICENGKRISKRYYGEDLQLAASPQTDR